MLRVLVIDAEYYAENANTLIVERLCRKLSNSVEITVASFQHKGARSFYSDAFSVVSIPYYSLNILESDKHIKLTNWLGLLSDYIMTRVTGTIHEREKARLFVRSLINEIDTKNFDLIFSVSNPFISHDIANRLSNETGIPWIAYYVDPFFTNATFSSYGFGNRKKYEERILHRASEIMMTYPTDRDYIENRVSFSDRIVEVQMPGIRTDYLCAKQNEHNRIKCYFIGNLYSSIRNPSNVIKLFGCLSDLVDIYFVGGYYGKSLNNDDHPDNVHFLGRKDNKEIIDYYNDADILINIGNSITNQMPSKILEYISIGKPILNFYKKRDCPTLVYTKRYELACDIYEEDIINSLETTAFDVRTFILENKGKKIELDKIQSIFESNTFENCADVIFSHFSGLLEQINES